MFYRDCTKLYIIWLVFLYHLLAHSSYHRTYSKLSYIYLSCIRRFSFNLYFRVCRRLPLRFQIFKGTGEKEYDSAFLKSTDFPNFKL